MEVELLATAWMLLGGNGGGRIGSVGAEHAETRRELIKEDLKRLFFKHTITLTSVVGLLCPSLPHSSRSFNLLVESPNLHLIMAVRD